MTADDRAAVEVALYVLILGTLLVFIAAGVVSLLAEVRRNRRQVEGDQGGVQ